MSPAAAFREGLRRVNGAPALLAGMFAVTLIVSLPLAYALEGMIAAHLDASLAADAAASGANPAWWREFLAQASGLGTTFVPSVAGFGAVLNNLSGFLDGTRPAPTIIGVTVAWMVLWSFLTGGVIDRLARARRTRSQGFFAACGLHFWRLLRLGVAALIAYSFLFRYVHGWIFEDAYGALTRDVTLERSAFVLRAAGYCGLRNAPPRLQRHSRLRPRSDRRRGPAQRHRRPAGGGSLRGPPRGASTWVIRAECFSIPSARHRVRRDRPRRHRDPDVAMWLVLGLGELYILGRHYLKLLFYASETAFFQGALAHAAYTAAPVPVWPDSPAAEMIGNADPTGHSVSGRPLDLSSRVFRNARILIVDDEPINVDLLRRLLERAGFSRIESTNDSRQALDLYVKFRPDLILLDLHMPHRDGLEVMDDLNQIAEASYLPILMLTGDDTPEAKREALSRGAKDFLNKPFHTDEVLLRIGTLLETRFLYLQIQSQNQILEAKVRDRTRELEAAQIEIIERLARAAEFRDDNTGQHTERVGQMAALTGAADRSVRHAGVVDPTGGAAARRRQDRHS